MTDREILEKKTQERILQDEAKAKAQAKKEADAKEAWQQQMKMDQEKTAELLKYCKETFEGHKLQPSGHPIEVSTSLVWRCHNTQSDGIEYVGLTITHIELGQGMIPILLCRFKNGKYEMKVGTETMYPHDVSFDEFRTRLIDSISNFGADELHRALVLNR